MTLNGYFSWMFLLTFLFEGMSFAALPKGQTIFSKLTDNSGRGIYRIEQEVLFQNDKDRISVKETWWVENENTLKLQVQGLKEHKDQLKMTYLYQGRNKLINLKGEKKSIPIGSDFTEKFFHYRKPENLISQLIQFGILNSSYLQKKAARSVKDFEYSTDPLLRLSRLGGVVNYAFGEPSIDENLKPGLWVEQDQFVLRKLRFPSGAELTADEITPFSKGLVHPKQQTIKWTSAFSPALISVQAVSWRGEKVQNFFSAQSLESSDSDSFEHLPLKDPLTEFYKRFR